MIKKNYIFAGFLILILSLSVVAFPLSATAENPNEKSNGKPQIVSAMGTIPGKNLNVHIWVLVPHGADKNEVVTQALAKQGAKPFVSEKFVPSGLYWDQFGNDGNPNNDFVPQYYNPANNPSGDYDGTILKKTHSTWNSVSSSSFAFSYIDETTRCPSLVQECPFVGQYFDGYNDFAWLPLGQGVLGVTWSGTVTDEADIALSTNFNWYADGINDYDIETVLLHENGHALGLSHSEYIDAVMWYQYQEVRRDLHSDDIAGVSYLYPASNPTNQPPISDAGGPYTVTEDTPISFDGSLSDDPDGTIVSYDWDFGDGGTGTGVNPSHTYTTPGTYFPSLTVIDNDGATDTDSASVTVNPSTSDPYIEITYPIVNGTVVTGKITITASVTGVSNPTVEFSLWNDDGSALVLDLDDDDDGAPYDTSLHTKNIPAGTFVIKAQIDLGGGEILDNRTIIKEPKGGGGSDDPDGGPTGGPPCSKKPLHHHCPQP